MDSLLFLRSSPSAHDVHVSCRPTLSYHSSSYRSHHRALSTYMPSHLRNTSSIDFLLWEIRECTKGAHGGINKNAIITPASWWGYKSFGSLKLALYLLPLFFFGRFISTTFSFKNLSHFKYDAAVIRSKISRQYKITLSSMYLKSPIFSSVINWRLIHYDGKND